MAFRFRCNLRFQPGSGMAAWAHAQNSVRIGMAYHLNESAANEEKSRHTVEGDTYRANFFFPGEELALDTFATLTAGSVTAWLKPDTDGDRSFVDVHECGHDQDPPAPCPQPTVIWPPTVTGPAVEAWQPWDGISNDYQLGAEVTHNGQTWTSTHPGQNTWEPGTTGTESLWVASGGDG